MGTNAITTIIDCGKNIATIFKRYDGYPKEWGVLQAVFLTKIRNRHQLKKEFENPFDFDKFEKSYGQIYFLHEGLSHLLPKMISFFISIENVNDISLVEKDFDCQTISYYYEIITNDKYCITPPIIKCYDSEKNILFSGTPVNFLKASHLFIDR